MASVGAEQIGNNKRRDGESEPELQLETEASLPALRWPLQSAGQDWLASCLRQHDRKECTCFGAPGLTCTACGSLPSAVRELFGRTICVVYAFQNKWSVLSFGDAFRKKVQVISPTLARKTGERLGFHYYGCRERHILGETTHWCFVVLISWDRRVHHSDAAALFTLCDAGVVRVFQPGKVDCTCISAGQGRTHTHADWFATTQSRIACASKAEQFGEPVWSG